MSNYSAISDYKTSKSKFMIKEKEIKNNDYWLMNVYCVEQSKKIPDNRLDLVV